MDFVGHWTRRTGLAQLTLIVWLGIAPSKYHDWKRRYGHANEHNGQIPRDFWVEDWEREADVEIIVQRAREKYPGHRTRIISDNGPQFIARDFKSFVREVGLDHVRTSPYYPQSNGKKERFYQTLKGECLRPQTPLSLDDARRVVGRFVTYYNEVRLHSAIGYITPKDMLEGRADQIHAERDRKLEEARERRRLARSPEAA